MVTARWRAWHEKACAVMDDEPYAKRYEEWRRRYAQRHQRTDWRGVHVTLAIVGLAAMIGFAVASLLS